MAGGHPMDSTRARRAGVIVAACVFLTALSWPTRLKQPETPASASYTFVDTRPPEQFKSKFESLMVTNCAYGSIRIGDKDFTPGLASVLTNHLSAHFNEALAGRKVRLVNFTVHQNGSVNLRASMTAAMPGFIDDVANDHSVTGCAADDLRGSYVASEVPAGRVPWVVVIDVEIDSTPLHVRWVQPQDLPREIKGATRAESRELRLQAWDRELGSAIDAALAKLSEQIEAKIAPPAQPAASGTPPLSQ